MIAAVLPTLKTFRNRMREVWSLPWQQTGNNERILYAISIIADLLGDAVAAGIASRFPGVYSYESLGIIGHERRITRGPYESDATYALRLRRWLDDHRRRGSAYAMLAQLHAYYAPQNFPITLIYRSGRRFHMAADGTITRDIVEGGFVIDDELPQKWARWWLFYETDHFGAPSALTPEDIADLRHVPREWNAAHCLGTIVVMTPGTELWNWPLGRTWDESGTWDVPGDVAFIPVD